MVIDVPISIREKSTVALEQAIGKSLLFNCRPEWVGITFYTGIPNWINTLFITTLKIRY